MSKQNIIRAWKDENYRRSLSEAERAALPENPAGRLNLDELTAAELAEIDGGYHRPDPGFAPGWKLALHEVTPPSGWRGRPRRPAPEDAGVRRRRGRPGSRSTAECLKQQRIWEGEPPSEPLLPGSGRGLALPIDPKFEVP